MRNKTKGDMNTQYSVCALTDAVGDVVEHYRYLPYGEVRVYTGKGADGEWFTGDDEEGSFSRSMYAFTGRRYDPESGLYYFRNRYYAPGLGRFVSRDPAGYVDGLNMYRGYFVPNGVDAWGKFKMKFKCCSKEEQETIEGLWDDLEETVERMVEDLSVYGVVLGAEDESRFNRAMKECFGIEGERLAKEATLNQIRDHLEKVLTAFRKGGGAIECIRKCNPNNSGSTPMLSLGGILSIFPSISWGAIGVCKAWIKQASKRDVAGTILHEGMHRYAHLSGWREWYYSCNSVGCSWTNPSGDIIPGVQPSTPVAANTPDAYKCMLFHYWGGK